MHIIEITYMKLVSGKKPQQFTVGIETKLQGLYPHSKMQDLISDISSNKMRLRGLQLNVGL
jgi:hypothetical protein